LNAGIQRTNNAEKAEPAAKDDPQMIDADRNDDSAAPLAPGLYLVATPIGNLGDITLRALDVLRRADRIACEDTRQTQKLLNHFEIATPTVSCHEHNERQRAAELVEVIKAGGRIAVVSDAGMPGISDPGARLAASAIAAGVAVIPIPGANAALSGLVASGLSTAEFHFIGFLPEKAGARRTRLEDLAAESARSGGTRTLVIYEAPHRILETLGDLEAVWGTSLRVVVARELTKIHEEFLRGTAAEVRQELASRDRVRGEIVLLVEALPRTEGLAGSQAASNEKISARIARIQAEAPADAPIDENQALKRLARELGQSKSDLYRELQRERARRR
jgi:16S rRNA (cytidine1402-2'-O)-methyltransferase